MTRIDLEDLSWRCTNIFNEPETMWPRVSGSEVLALIEVVKAARVIAPQIGSKNGAVGGREFRLFNEALSPFTGEA